MTAIALLVTAAISAGDLSTVSGRVLDERGNPLVGAQVFLEQGLAGTLESSRTDSDGGYRFENILPGFSGVFAHASGHAFGGRSVHVAIADDIAGTDIVLRRPGKVSGTVSTRRDRPVAGARITRVLLDKEVSIPFSKLVAYGFKEPRTDSRGKFSVPSLPKGAEATLKIAHPQFAQEVKQGIRVGDDAPDIVLTTGVLMTGHVLARGSDAVVPNATIYFINALPPNDTVITRSGGDGSFNLRLRPGAYFYKSSGTNFRSPAMQRIVVTGQLQTERVALRVAGTSSVKGTVKDASTAEPVAGARVVLEAYGTQATITRTGPTGEFHFNAAEGESVVRLDPVPGYLEPPRPAMRINTKANRDFEVPTFWVLQIPEYVLEVVDGDEQPVAGAVVRVLRPAQFGWHTTDADGIATLSFAQLPRDGTVIGMVEHPSKPESAVFSIKRERSEDAIVQLLPSARVEGKVRLPNGADLEGAVVEARFVDNAFPEAVVLWQTLTTEDGRFTWDGATAQLPQYCAALAQPAEEGLIARGDSESFIPNVDMVTILDDIVVENGKSESSVLGRKLKWYDRRLLCGELPSKQDRRDRGAVVVYCSPEEAPIVAEALEKVQQLLGRPTLLFGLVVDGDVPCAGTTLPVLRGKSPALATTYLLDGTGTVVLETFGMPPLFAINRIAPLEP